MAKLQAKRRGETISFAEVVGIDASSNMELSDRVQDGFPYSAFTDLTKAMDLTQRTLANLVQISERTLTRRREEGRLKADESERVLRISRLLVLASELFEGDRNAARKWLFSRNRALGGKTPLEASKTEIGSREVENLITRLEHGVYS